MPIEHLKTARELIPRFGRLIRDLRPTFHLRSAADIDPRFVHSHGIRGIVWDVDGTLMGYHRRSVDDAVRPAFDELLAHPSLRHTILSNCDEVRFLELGEIFPRIPILRAYRMGGQIIYRSLTSGVDTHTPSDIQKILESGHHLRKPSGELVRHAAQVLELETADVLVVGDQYLTDVASARLSGARSAKVPTLRPESFPASIRFTQLLEVALFRVRHGWSTATY